MVEGSLDLFVCIFIARTSFNASSQNNFHSITQFTNIKFHLPSRIYSFAIAWFEYCEFTPVRSWCLVRWKTHASEWFSHENNINNYINNYWWYGCTMAVAMDIKTLWIIYENFALINKHYFSLVCLFLLALSPALIQTKKHSLPYSAPFIFSFLRSPSLSLSLTVKISIPTWTIIITLTKCTTHIERAPKSNHNLIFIFVRRHSTAQR